MSKKLLLLISLIVMGMVGIIIGTDSSQKDDLIVSDDFQIEKKSDNSFSATTSINYATESLNSSLSSISIVYTSLSSSQVPEKEGYSIEREKSRSDNKSPVIQKSRVSLTNVDEEEFKEEKDIDIDNKLYEKYRNIYPPSVPSEKLYNNFPPPPPQ